ncbi:unnamed protein product [Aphanomyces euteiches]
MKWLLLVSTLVYCLTSTTSAVVATIAAKSHETKNSTKPHDHHDNHHQPKAQANHTKHGNQTTPKHGNASHHSANRPLVVYQDWCHVSCSQRACRREYAACLDLFHGDGCSCYPGLLDCALNHCVGIEFERILATCYDALPQRNHQARCALTCAPGLYPFDDSTGSTNQTNSTGKNESTIHVPRVVSWSVVTSLSIHNASNFSAPAVKAALIHFLAKTTKNHSKLTADNVTLHAENDTAAGTLVIDVVIACDSLDEMNATDQALEQLAYESSTPLGQEFVGAGLVAKPAQVSVSSVKTFVVADTDKPATTAPPVEEIQSTSTLFGMSQGMFMVVAAGGAALLALVVACICIRCRKKHGARGHVQ